MKLNKYFSRKEFKCRCNTCNCDTVDAKLLEVLTYARTYFGRPLHINSGNRCVNHNIRVGGKKTSQHLTGRAADITVEGYSPEEVYTFFNTVFPEELGLGLYKEFVHVDTRNKKARWHG